MSFVRLLLYSNELDLQAMIAATSVWQKTATHPETMHKLIAAFGQVRPSLLLNAKGWPEAATLDSRVFAGQSAYGMAATGPGKDSAGAQALLRAMEREDPRPLWISLVTNECLDSSPPLTSYRRILLHVPAEPQAHR